MKILAGNQHRLVVALTQHIVVSVIRNGENVWRHLRLSLGLVATDNVVIVDRKPLVGIDGDTEETRVGVDQETNITLRQVVDNRCLGEVSHVGQILKQLVLWRILLVNLIVRNVLFFAVSTKNLQL